MDDDEIRTLVARLSRRHPSGGKAIARAAIMAEGADATEVIRWILAHDGRPEAGAPASGGPSGGLHERRGGVQTADADRPPVRYIVPAEALAPPGAEG